MKRSILFIGIVLLAVLFALSSCDMILNAAYPEFNPDNQGSGMGDNSVHISMTVNNLDVCMSSLKIALVPVLDKGDGTFELQIDKAWIQSFWCMNSIDYWFGNLGKNQYRIFTWLETLSDDNKPGADEPSGIGTISDAGYINAELFDFREVTQATTINATAYLDNYSRLDFSWIEKWNPGGTIVDNSFQIYGPNTIDRAYPPYSNIYIYPNAPANVISNVQFKIADGNGGEVAYDNHYDFQVASGTTEFMLDFVNLLNPAFSDDLFWSNTSYMVIKVIVTYTSGATYQSEYWTSVYDSLGGGTSTYYNLYINPQFDTTASYGYAYVYLVDHDNQNTLYYNSAYLDGSGYYPFSFYGIEDPADLDQDILVYIYDQYWNYLGTWTQTISGVTSGDVTWYIDDGGIFSPTSTSSVYYDLTVLPQFSGTAPYGYAEVYLSDTATGSTLAYNSTYLDGSGYYPFSFYGIYDPAGADQYIGVYLYDQYWNYLGYYTQNVDSGHGSTITYYVWDGGSFSIGS